VTDWPKVKITDLVTHVRAQAVLNDESHYELWSIPSFEFQTPERVLGTSIQSGKFLLRSDDVLLGKINPRINRVWVVSEPSISISQIGSTEWIVLRPKSSLLDSHYLAYYLRSPKFRDVFTASVTGTTGSHTRGKPVVALEYLIPLPPLDEQKRIVAKLDEALDGIDAAAQNVLNSLAAAIDFSESLLEEMLLM
jgi:type I restriction enzyme S subunit